MQIFVDADACPVVAIIEKIAKDNSVPVMLLCDTNHVLSSTYSKVVVVGAGADAVDYKLISICHKGDIVVSQDYGVAAMALGKGAYAIHQSGKWYTDDNIDQMLMERHLSKKARRSSRKCHVMGLKKRMEVTHGRPVIGVSGGLDSTLALLVATEAARRMGKPTTDVVGITMPCFGTTDRTYRNSLELMRTLGITALEIPIAAAVEQHFRDIGQDRNTLDLTFENAQARERTQVLMDYAGRIGGFVAGTGDLSELALGWCTYNADHMSMYGVNCGVPKTLVRWMIDSILQSDRFASSDAVLRDILDTPISPELLPPDAEGKIAQQTEEIVGPYALHDFFLYYTVRFGFLPEKVFALAVKAFCNDFDRATIKKWLLVFYRRFFTQQFKRSCLPDGVKLGSICLSPRGDWRMPSDASAELWLARTERIGV
mgnify:CR=1 FL=1